MKILIISEKIYPVFAITILANIEISPIIWSIRDFQGSPDFFIFLPYFSIGFAWMVYSGFKAITSDTRILNIGLILTIISITTFSWFNYQFTRTERLFEQYANALRLQKKYLRHPEDQILSVGRPEILVLLEMTNPNRYPVLYTGYDIYIDQNTTGGIMQWFEEELIIEPKIVFVTYGPGNFAADQMIDLLISRNFTEERFGNRIYYVNPKSNN